MCLHSMLDDRTSSAAAGTYLSHLPNPTRPTFPPVPTGACHVAQLRQRGAWLLQGDADLGLHGAPCVCIEQGKGAGS